MIIWTIKLIKTIKAAIAGRRYPHQLAGAVAVGALLGVVPHGNLLALAILIVVLTLRVNHAMAGLTAIGVSYLSTRLDPYSHDVGNYVLTQPDWGNTFTRAWQWPLVPWTDLNNTVVMGSFLIGVAALLPIYLVSYRFFKMVAPTEAEEQETADQETRHANRNLAQHSVVLVDSGHGEVSTPHVTPETAPVPTPAAAAESTPPATSTQRPEVTSARIEPAHENASRFAPDKEPLPERSEFDFQSSQSDGRHVAVETRIDVIRMEDYRKESVADVQPTGDDNDTTAPQMDEALNYLLRQLRDSQQRKAG